MTREAKLVPREHGSSPAEGGWFVVNARDAAWVDGPFGSYTGFEGADARFAQVGVNIAVLSPGEPNCLYHAENEQEDFLVLDGECLLIIEREERPLRRWDFVHCPAWTAHVFVGAGERPCVLLAVGTRIGRSVIYPAAEAAGRHGAGAEHETDDPDVAYASFAPDTPAAFEPGWLPGT